MGLRADFTVFDLGYAESTDEVGVFIDYSLGCEIFAETFLRVAKNLVPVDTGYLRSTLRASASDEGCCCETLCDYAEYVEYGTIYMGAQPYFEPAIDAALDAAIPYWDSAVDEALEEEAELLAEEEEEGGGLGRGGMRAQAYGGMRGGVMRGGFGGFLGMIFGAIIVGLIVGFLSFLSNEMASIGSGSSRGSHSVDVGGGLYGSGGGIDIEII